MSSTPSSGHIFSYDYSLHDGKELLPSHQEAESDRFGELKTTAVILLSTWLFKPLLPITRIFKRKYNIFFDVNVTKEKKQNVCSQMINVFL